VSDASGRPQITQRKRPRGLRLLRTAAITLVALVAALAGLRQLARARTVQLFGTLVSRVETRDSLVALTFDDGPAPALVDSVIRMLAARDARATFFVMGSELADAPQAGPALVAAGHELGNHSYSHQHMVLKSPSFVRDEIERTDALIRAAGQQGPILFRPPFCYKLAVLPYYLWRTGRTTVTWDIEPDSYAEVTVSPEAVTAYVLARVRPGSIVLLHPWHPARATVLAAVPQLADSLRARGYRMVTMRELLAAGR